MKTLIADDDPTTRLLLRSALKKLGHEVDEARDGREAFDAWSSQPYPLVISDWRMPEIDGLEFCRKVRAEQRPSYTYIVLLTIFSGKTNYLEGMNAGADDFIVKPLEMDELAARVTVARRILDLHQRLRDANHDLERRVEERTAELKSALEAKSEFLSRASHELRTPMNQILGFAQVLENDGLQPRQLDSVSHILTAGYRLLGHIDRILAVSKSSPEEMASSDFLKLQPSSAVSQNGDKLPDQVEHP